MEENVLGTFLFLWSKNRHRQRPDVFLVLFTRQKHVFHLL
jgi:hypothetical protein